MSRDNSTTLIGNLTDDPELRFTQGGVPLASFRLAVNEYRGPDKDPGVTFWSCTYWGEDGEVFANDHNKGDRVIVLGTLQQRSYEKDGRDVWVTEVKVDEAGPSYRFAGKRNGSSAKRPSAPPVQQPQKDYEDVPF